MEKYKNGHYYSLNEYLQKIFGCKVYKLALDGGFTCPNRDGTLDTRGCIFCSGGGSGEFAQKGTGTVAEQIKAAKGLAANKLKTGKYIAYFQAFTNTYAPVDYLKKLFWDAVCCDDIVALSIATRPDCLPSNVVQLLADINKVKPVWVELGLQTIHERSAEYIRRGYSLNVYRSAVKQLKSYNINVVTHVILGLPFESREEMLQTVEYVGKSGSDGIKLQLLHVLKGTDLALDYESGLFNVLTLDEYINILCDCIEILPPETVIHRLTGDGDKKLLVAPKWSGNKKMVLNAINRTFNDRNILQGRKYNV